MKTFGSRLKELRIAKGITQKELAEYLHLRNTTISNWENDMGEPPYETLKKICKYFEVSADYLLGLEE